jgi:hypothetical protein
MIPVWEQYTGVAFEFALRELNILNRLLLKGRPHRRTPLKYEFNHTSIGFIRRTHSLLESQWGFQERVLWRESDVDFFKAPGEKWRYKYMLYANIYNHVDNILPVRCVPDPIKCRQGPKTKKSGRLLVLGHCLAKKQFQDCSLSSDQAVLEDHCGWGKDMSAAEDPDINYYYYNHFENATIQW